MDTPVQFEIADSGKAPLVLVVLLNWNSYEETRTAVESVERMDYPNFRILIVDNGSQDGSANALKELTGERVDLLALPANTGYTGGCNLGMERALAMGAQYIWLLNNDAVVGPTTLSSIVAMAESDDRIGLVTPQIAALDEDRLTFAGGVISTEDGVYEDTNDPVVAAEWSERYPDAGLVIGTAMLVRAEVVRRIGVLDPAFFAYFEDIDYSVRSAKAGFRNVVDPNSVVWHLEKNHNKKPNEIHPHYWYYMARNESRFWRKHLGLLGGLRLSWDSFNRFLRNRNRLSGEPERDAILAGLWDGWLNRGGPYNPDARMPALPAAVVGFYSRRRALQPAEKALEKSEVRGEASS
jgi:GT2 family glycosyltransferase